MWAYVWVWARLFRLGCHVHARTCVNSATCSLRAASEAPWADLPRERACCWPTDLVFCCIFNGNSANNHAMYIFVWYDRRVSAISMQFPRSSAWQHDFYFLYSFSHSISFSSILFSFILHWKRLVKTGNEQAVFLLVA